MKVQTRHGPVAGEASPRGGERFLALPYAAPPVGPLRWRPPRPPLPWTQVRPAAAFPPAPRQGVLPPDHLLRQFSFADPPESGMDEDCLYLNVYRPGRGAGDHAPLPVVFFVYGGGHSFGSASHPVSWGERLAAQGCVVVVANYRLGAMGYLAHPHLTAEAGSSGNYASLDILAALSWVRDNIAGFGGDPGRVTVFGQSAGAAHVNVLLVSERARGLFHRAIVMSGGRMRGGAGGVVRPLSAAEQDGASLMEGLGAGSLEEMRALPAQDIAAPLRFFNLVVDGHVLTAEPQDRFDQGRCNAVPLIAGFTAQEASHSPAPEWATPDGLDQFSRRFGERRGDVLRLYDGGSGAAALASSYRLQRDLTYAYQAWRQAREMSKFAPCWLLELRQAPPLPPGSTFSTPEPPGGYGAYHGSDLWYAFGNMDRQPWPWSQTDQDVRHTLQSAIVAFAASGDPNTGAAPPWPQHGDDGLALRLGADMSVGPPSNIEALRLFEATFAPQG